MEFVQSFKSWLRENELQEVQILQFGETRLVRGDRETIFLSKKLPSSGLDPNDLQIVKIDTNLCLCKNGNGGEVVGSIKAN